MEGLKVESGKPLINIRQFLFMNSSETTGIHLLDQKRLIAAIFSSNIKTK
jgi:hypothetical protein